MEKNFKTMGEVLHEALEESCYLKKKGETSMNIIETLEPIPAGANPFHHDSHHMGMSFGLEDRMVVMYDDKLDYVILIDRKTGKRLKIHID